MNVMPQLQAGRLLGVGRKSIQYLISAGVLRADPRGRVSTADVARLQSMQGQMLPAGHPPLLQVVKNPDELGPSMYLSDTSHLSGPDLTRRNQDLRAWRKKFGLSASSSMDFTGFWEISSTNVSQLVPGGLVVATIARFGTEVARIVDVADVVPYRGRRVLLVDPLSGAAANPYLIYYPDLVRHTKTHP